MHSIKPKLILTKADPTESSSLDAAVTKHL